MNFLNAGFISLWQALPVLATLITFAIYTANQPQHFLAPSVAFVALTLFDHVKNGLNHVPHSIAFIIEVSRRLLHIPIAVCIQSES